MGAGSFSLPWAFAKLGYIGGPLWLVFLMYLSVQSLNMLVQAASLLETPKKSLSTNHHLRVRSSYVEVARAAFGSTGARISYLLSISASIGVCGSYLVFVGANLESLFLENSMSNSNSNKNNDNDNSSTFWNQTTLIVCFVAPTAIFLSSIRNMQLFALTSTLGDISVVLGMLVVMIYGLWNHAHSLGRGCAAFSGFTEAAPLALGSIGYLFLVHFLSLPIVSEMRHPERFPRVATNTFAGCALVSGAFGVLGYLLFGANANQIVLLNIQKSSIFVQMVQFLLCIDLLLTYPVVMRPSILILEQSCFWGPSSQQQRSYTLACVVLGIAAASAALFVPAFGLLSGFVGGVAQVAQAFVLPPLMLKQLQQRTAQRGIATTTATTTAAATVGFVGLGAVMILWTVWSTWQEVTRREG